MKRSQVFGVGCSRIICSRVKHGSGGVTERCRRVKRRDGDIRDWSVLSFYAYLGSDTGRYTVGRVLYASVVDGPQTRLNVDGTLDSDVILGSFVQRTKLNTFRFVPQVRKESGCNSVQLR
jgi:hypothetical protein